MKCRDRLFQLRELAFDHLCSADGCVGVEPQSLGVTKEQWQRLFRAGVNLVIQREQRVVHLFHHGAQLGNLSGKRAERA